MLSNLCLGCPVPAFSKPVLCFNLLMFRAKENFTLGLAHFLDVHWFCVTVINVWNHDACVSVRMCFSD